MKTYCRVHTNRNRLLFEITITKTLDRAQEGVMGEGGRGRWLSAIELCTIAHSLFNYEQRKVKHYQEVQIIAEDYDIVLSRRQYY